MIIHVRPLELIRLQAGQWAKALLPLHLPPPLPQASGATLERSASLTPARTKRQSVNTARPPRPDQRAPLGFKLELRRTSGVVSEILSICCLH